MRKTILFPSFIDEYSGKASDNPTELLSPIPVPEPKIGVYTGKGASHSWLWAFDTFEKAGVYSLYPFDESELHLIEKFNLIFISGGDTFAVAEGLGEKGAEKIRQFLNEGGVYFGVCAGAYLPLHSSRHPLNLFNFIRIPVANVERELPPVKDMPHKAFNRYGCCFLIHPVRGELLVETTEFPPSFQRKVLKAPLFGGPVFTEPERGTVLARYMKFTERTHFLYERAIADKILPGKPAIVMVPYGRGVMFLAGPHLEHPSFTGANELLMRFIAYALGKFSKAEKDFSLFDEGVERRIPESVRRNISDIMRVALSIGDLNVLWKVGEKVYMPEHLLAFAKALYRRSLKMRNAVCKEEEIEMFGNILEGTLKIIKKKGRDEKWAEALIENMKSALRVLFKMYFRTIRRKHGSLRTSAIH